MSAMAVVGCSAIAPTITEVRVTLPICQPTKAASAIGHDDDRDESRKSLRSPQPLREPQAHDAPTHCS